MSDIIGVLAICAGLFFYIFGIVGMMRFPDVYSRIHSAGKVSVLGIIFFVVGTAFLMPEASFKVIVLGTFMIVTQPVSSHAIANAAYRSQAPTSGWVRDDLERDRGTVKVDDVTMKDSPNP